ncbi:hypothetical protein WHR41_07200 [Cladosporium halotolerans]|uniref:Alternative oxidase n=1 Tax=Cladosporium halotolerans TaxID=1052096 RepID=A0AB34KGI0_9PEZI
MYPSIAVDKRHRTAYGAVLFLVLIPLYYASWQYHAARPSDPSPAHTTRPPSTNFVGDWLSVQVVEPFDPSALRHHCKSTEWRPTLIFNLDNANGGIGNVRGNILDFIFSAIEAGASIILPGMAARSSTDISNVWGGHAPFDAFFDQAWFFETMGKTCPQMTIYRSAEDVRPDNVMPDNYLPSSRRIDLGEENTKQAYLEHLDSWLKSKPDYSPANRTLVNLERTLWDIDTRSLPPSLRRSLPQSLRLNPSIRRLAALATQTLAFQTPLDPLAAIPQKAFYAAHLRTESDAAAAGWLANANANFSAQTDAYIAHALSHDLRTLYVASGNASELARFRAKAGAHDPPLTVTSKRDLLPPDALRDLDALTWDQQALVDYEVLQRASVFGGFVKSSFSFGVAMARGQRREDLARVAEPWLVQWTEDGVAFDDGWSRIVGRDGWHEERIPRGMWP